MPESHFTDEKTTAHKHFQNSAHFMVMSFRAVCNSWIAHKCRESLKNSALTRTDGMPIN